MTYPETIQYLESFINYEKISSFPYKESLKLERVKDFLKILNNPQETLKCIHIAGTKGKGSSSAFIAYILREAGYRTGLYTSPHLSDFRERIRILKPSTKHRAPSTDSTDFEGMISKDELCDLAERLRSPIEKFNSSSKYGPLTFFEVYTALAFVYFKEKKVDFAVLETGLGGRLDATNVVSPLIAVITPISYEHTQKLGNTLREIATEKAGIIKNRRASCVVRRALTVISAPQEVEAIEVIRNRCKDVGARLCEVGKDIFYSCQLPVASCQFRVKGLFGNYPDLKIRLLGEHQFVNASVAVGVVEALRNYAVNISISSIREGLYNTIWPGRCEIVSKLPLVVLDGAQNIASMKVLKETIKKSFKYKRLILVLGISNDKDIKGICDEIQGLADEIILTKANNPRAAKPETLAKCFSDKKAYVTNNIREAKRLALGKAKKQDLILITGSLFVVGEARRLFVLT